MVTSAPGTPAVEPALMERRLGLETFLRILIEMIHNNPSSPFYKTSKRELEKTLPFFKAEGAGSFAGIADPSSGSPAAPMSAAAAPASAGMLAAGAPVTANNPFACDAANP